MEITKRSYKKGQKKFSKGSYNYSAESISVGDIEEDCSTTNPTKLACVKAKSFLWLLKYVVPSIKFVVFEIESVEL